MTPVSPPTTSRAASARRRRRSTSPSSPRAAAPARCCGTSTRRARHVPVPRQAARQGRRAQARRAARATPARCSRAPTTSGWTCCRPTSPTATWTSRSTRPSGRRGASPACWRRCATTTTTSSSTARRASRWSSENIFEAADVLLVPLIPAPLSLAHLRPAARRRRAMPPAAAVLAFFSMVDARKRLHREVMRSWPGARRRPDDRHPGRGGRRADGAAPPRPRADRAAQPRRPGLRGALGRAARPAVEPGAERAE